MRHIATSNWFMDRQKYPKSRTSIRIWQPETLDSILCHTFPGMGDRTLKDILLHDSTLQFFLCAKGFNSSGPLKWFYCALQSNRILWLRRARARQSDSKLRNSRASKSTCRLAQAASVSSLGNLKACLAADLGFKEIHVDARACDVKAARGAGCAAGPAPRHQPSESGTKAI